MTSQEKANWIRRIFTLGLIGAAAAAGLYFAMPNGWWKGLGKAAKKSGQVNKENFAQIQASPNQLTVINMVVEGNPDSKKLQEVLEKLKKDKYGERVVMTELNVNEEPELAASQGVKKEEFAGQLDFHANGKKLEQLVGQTDPVVVEKTIDRLLAGLVQRIGKDWLPDVPGMQRNQGQEVLKVQPAEPAPPSRKP
ncbi:hypothetical protein OKA05_07890 [Luteolibacter arcticus]|uniref:Uncharacterized protein n=1 Tax=Luteolibacter arcticus TaxID=1581411 RepID=A0ABT3GFR8_9BACT|nr:hypothetical protein [Luteolibacter arcticus]MCW1922472.1 hypothetical protein [Luteolibacter arcticus]